MKLTMVVVFYEQKIEQAKTFVSLSTALTSRGLLQDEVNIVLYDNSKEKQDFNTKDYPDLPFTYVHDPRNLGIATAYNYAWAVAQENGSDWLLLFDHDTQVTKEYIDQIMLHRSLNESVVAVVPKITTNQVMISPVYSDTLRPLANEKPTEGLQTKPVMAINSGSLISVDFITEMGGFNPRFALDYLDHWIFFEIYARGKKVLLLDVTLEHELSVMDYNSISLNRYKSILGSEFEFYSNYKKDLFGEYRKQLLKRLLKQILTVKNKQIALHTLRKILNKD
jgi:GT2 family glycosyltransferase